jgi:FAD:protein FMN transferase
MVTLARHAMATRFELVLHGMEEPRLRGAGEEALDEIERIENRLSLYRPHTEIAHINARAGREPVQVSPEVFELLIRAKQLHAQTGGAFDIAIGRLVNCWGFMGGTGRMPEASELEDARNCSGLLLVELDSTRLTVRFSRPGVLLDLGAIGKGYAIEQAANILRESGVSSALLHGGTSTVCAIGKQPDGQRWLVALPHPSEPDKMLGKVPLEDQSLSISAVWGRAFKHEEKIFGHVLDPRTGRPVENTCMSAVVLSSATETDALSTALLTLGPEGIDTIRGFRPNARLLVATKEGGSVSFAQHGFDAVLAGPSS